ncbi:hypothetical protein CAOG_03623 [Capsaspora owczarzaki ATCC 30864]|uniref:Glutamine amidotransferase type-2 domain-containing protein n=1 Tax=Capsaspora owczarzaki (strain ATCC 30864) TaxID=595528 RepID=A0A0D2X2K3_CAPO3|nr:hypothetical protein CAOG_03623 [Capsaspora owczarzaki ATCC 30864]KJE92709.1 hypothetical protein CAOG_003623 [Capsaspora owczarzaki ATCC 30864]|eukprot:XP_004363351.1 hypothetical protein CAOG_03623 [Capsaspora owczarzaki ATCC 30864]
MCGIALYFAKSDQPPPSVVVELTAALERRGPDSVRTQCVVEHAQPGLDMHVVSTVLHLRGDAVTPQPLMDATSGNVFAWNGEVFGGLEISVHSNDTQIVMDELLNRLAVGDPLSSDAVAEIVAAMFQTTIQGPFAFVFYHNPTRQLFFGRDYFGRRSLLWHGAASTYLDQFMLSSVAGPSTSVSVATASTGNEEEADNSAPSPQDAMAQLSTSFWEEVPARGIYRMQLQTPTWQPQLLASLDRYPLNRVLPTAVQLDTTQPVSNELSKLPFSTAAAQLLLALAEAVRRRVCAVPASHHGIAVLFSGGVDCTVIAALAHVFAPTDCPVDLINVAFENHARASSSSKPPASASSSTSSAGSAAVAAANSDSPTIYNVPDRLSARASLLELRQAITSGTVVEALMSAIRIVPSETIPTALCAAVQCQSHAHHASSITTTTTTTAARFRLIQADIPRAELEAMTPHILSLVQPLGTVMDLSIGAALWFAARGSGRVWTSATEPASPEVVQTDARVLLVGMGADEQLAGYGRHRTKYNVGGWPALVEEVALDVRRISARNLGRDDRCISDHGRESRIPFLDENVVALLSSLPIFTKANMMLSRGLGEKILLRRVALELGLPGAAHLAKRAIQFGSRIARMERGASAKGSDRL